MAGTLLSTITNNLRMRWRETYVSEGLNQKMTAIAAGIYRGFAITPSATVLSITIESDATTDDHVAVYETQAAPRYSLTVHMSGDFDVSLAAFTSQTIYIGIEATYSIGVDSTATLNAYTQAQYNAAPAGSIIVLGQVTVPASGTIPAANITYATRSSAFLNRPLEAVPWDPLIRNGGFERGPGGVALAPQQLPFWTYTSGFGGGSAHLQLNTNPAPSGGFKDLELVTTASPATVNGTIYQDQNVPATAGQVLRYRLYMKLLQVPTSGNIFVYVDWGDQFGAVLTEVYSTFVSNTNTIDGVYRLVDATFTAPANTVTLIRVGFFFSSCVFPTAGTVLQLDNFQAYLQILDPTSYYRFDERAGVIDVVRMITEAPFDQAPMIYMPHSVLDYSLLLHSPGTDGTGNSRLYTDSAGALYWTQNAYRNGVVWTKDVAGAASLMRYTANAIDLFSEPAGTNDPPGTWSSWTNNQVTLATGNTANQTSILAVGNGSGIGGEFTGGVTGIGIIVHGTVSNTKPQQTWEDAAGNIRGLIDHNGYRMGRTFDLVENWVTPAVAIVASATPIATLPRWSALIASGGTILPSAGGPSSNYAAPAVGIETSATNGSKASLYSAGPLVRIGTTTSIVIEFDLGLSANGTYTAYAGLDSNNDPQSSSTNAIHIRAQSGSANWQVDFIQSATTTTIDSGVAVDPGATDASSLRVRIEAHGASSPLGKIGLVFLNEVQVASSSNIPLVFPLNMVFEMFAGAAASASTLIIGGLKISFNRRLSLPAL
jgi:hypothetical protein